MSSSTILLEKKARAFQNGKLRSIANPLYQGDTYLDGESYPFEEYILEVYPTLCWIIGPKLPHYQGTRILIYIQLEDVKTPRYLILIDRVTGADVVFAYEIVDVIMVISPLAAIVQTDILTEIYEWSANRRGNTSSK